MEYSVCKEEYVLTIVQGGPNYSLPSVCSISDKMYTFVYGTTPGLSKQTKHFMISDEDSHPSAQTHLAGLPIGSKS